MTDPIRASIRKSPVDSTAAGAPPPASQEAPPTAAQNRDAAISDVHQTQRANPRQRTQISSQQAAAAVSRLYENGGTHEVNSYLQQNPSAARALASAPRGQVEAQMGCEAFDIVENFTRSQLRSGIRQTAQRTILARMGDLQNLRAEVLENPSRFTEAAAGSTDARVASMLGMRPGDNGAAAAQRIDEALAGLDDLHGRFSGNTWEVGDFPQSLGNAARDLGMRGGEGSMLSEFGGERATDLEHPSNSVAYGMHVGEGIHAVAEIAHAVGHGVRTAAGVAAGVSGAVGLIGLGVGYAIHHAVAERREQFLGDAANLGIR